MEYAIGGVKPIVADLANYSAIRLLHIGHPQYRQGPQAKSSLQPEVPGGLGCVTQLRNGSMTQLGNISCGQSETVGWSTSCPTTTIVNGQLHRACRTRFSGVCWLYARALFHNLDPPRPLGMIESNFGGTSDTLWSSPTALAKCGNDTRNNQQHPNSVANLWFTMIGPLLRSTISAVVWCAFLARLFLYIIYLQILWFIMDA